MKAMLFSMLILASSLTMAKTEFNETDSQPIIEAVRLALASQGQYFTQCELTGYMDVNTSVSISTLISNARTVTVREGSQPVIIAHGLSMKWTDSNYSNNHKVTLELEITTDSTFTQVTELVAVILPRQLGVDRVNQGTITRPVIVEVPRYTNETRYNCI